MSFITKWWRGENKTPSTSDGEQKASVAATPATAPITSTTVDDKPLSIEHLVAIFTSINNGMEKAARDSLAEVKASVASGGVGEVDGEEIEVLVQQAFNLKRNWLKTKAMEEAKCSQDMFDTAIQTFRGRAELTSSLQGMHDAQRAAMAYFASQFAAAPTPTPAAATATATATATGTADSSTSTDSHDDTNSSSATSAPSST